MFDFTKAEDPPKEQKNSFISLLMGSMYPGITLFARDVNLPPELAEKYKAGMIIREKGFTDTTIRFWGYGHQLPLCDPFQSYEEFGYVGKWNQLGTPCGK